MARDDMEAKIVVHIDSSPVPKEAKEVRKELNNALKLEPKTDALKKTQGDLAEFRNNITSTLHDIKKFSKVRLTSDELQKQIEFLEGSGTKKDGSKEKLGVIDKLEQKIARLKDAKALATDEKGSGSIDEYAAKIQRAENKLASYVQQLAVYKELKDKADASKTKSVIGYDLNKVPEKMEQLKNETDKAREATTQFRADHQATNATIKENAKAEQELADKTEQAAKASEELHDKGEAKSTVEHEANAANDFAKNLDNAANSADELHEKTNKTDENVKQTAADADNMANSFEKAASASHEVKIDLNADVSQMGQADLDKYISGLKSLMKEIRDAGMPAERKAEFEQANDQLIRAQRAAADYKKNLDKVAEATKALPPIDLNADVTKMTMAELKRYTQQLKNIKAEIEKANMPAERNAEYNQVTDQLIRAQRAASDYKKNLDRVAQAHQNAGRSANGFKAVVSTISSVFHKFAASTKSQFGSIHKEFSKLIGLAKNFRTSFTSGFKNLSTTLKGVKRNFDKLSNSMHRTFKHNFTNLVKYVLGFRSLFFLVRRLRKYIGEGLENLARYDDKVSKGVKSHNLFNDAMNKLMTSLNFLKNAWAAAFSPIVIKVVPILSDLIDKLAEAGNYVAYFIASLTGQATAYNALRTAVDDYADSLDKSGSSAKKNADKQDELNDKLGEYDKLLVIRQDKDKNTTPTGGSGDGNKTAEDFNKMFKTITADDNLGKALHDALENSDFTTVGNLIRDKLIEALTSIKWDEAKQKAASFGTNLGDFIVGFFEPDKNGNSIAKEVGKAIGNAFVTGNVFLNALLNKLKEHDWGKDISDAIAKFLETGLKPDPKTGKTGFQLAGENFATMIGIFVDTLCSAIMNFPTDSFITAITDFLKGALSPDDENAQKIPTKIGTALGKLFTDGTKVVNAIVKELKGYKWGSELADGFKAFLQEGLKKDPSGKSGWQLSGETVGNIVRGIVKTICDFVADFPLDDFKQAISDWLKGFKPGETIGTILKGTILIAKGVFQVTAAAIAGLADSISEEMKDYTISVNKVKLTDDKGILGGELDENGKPKPVELELKPTFDVSKHPLLAWIDRVMTDTGEFMMTAVFGVKDVDDTIKVADKLDEVVKEWTPFLKDAGNFFGILTSGVPSASVMEAIMKFFAQDKSKQLSDIKSFSTTVGTISDVLTGMPINTIIQNFDKIKEAIYGKDEMTKITSGSQYGKTTLKHTKKGLVDYWNELKNLFSQAFTDPLGTIKTALFDDKKGLMQYFTGKDGIVQKIKDKLGLGTNKKIGVVAALPNAFLNALPAIHTALFDDKKGLLKYFTGNDSLQAKIKKKISDSNILGTLADLFKDPGGTIKSAINKLINGYDKAAGKTGILSTKKIHVKGLAEQLQEAFEGIVKALPTPIKGALKKIQDFINGIIRGINDLSAKLNNLKITGVNPFTGKSYSYGFNIPRIDEIKIPGLAQGAVIPPNKEFLAVLGDQKQGTNIETPLDTMVDAFKIALADTGSTNHDPIVLQLNSRVVAQAVWDEEAKKYKQTGFGLAY